MELDDYARSVLDDLHARDLRRHLRPLHSASAPRVRVGDDHLLLMCSNDYLGLASDPRLAAAATDAAHRWGTGAGASRLVSGSSVLHAELEARLAALKGCADAVLFSSGYLANVGTIGALVGPGDVVVSDRLNHASIIDGCRLSRAEIRVYAHADADACASVLAQVRRERGDSCRILVVTDSVFSMDGNVAPLRELRAAARAAGAWLMVDEAHATGVLAGGRGAVAAAGLEGGVDVVLGTCSKALGSVGGFVAGSHALCELLRNRARSFVFDTALPGPAVAATLAALEVLRAEPDRGARAMAHARRMADALRDAGFEVWEPHAAIVAVIVGSSADALAVSARLLDARVLAPAIRPPTVPEGTARIRLCPMASHSDADIDQVIAAFGRADADAGRSRRSRPSGASD